MKERPILFSAPMVRAILGDTKTQTRRVMKSQPDDDGKVDVGEMGASLGVAYIRSDRGGQCARVPCPYGRPGDRLWVRETFVLENTSDYHGDHDVPKDDRPIKKHEDGDGNYWLIPHYRATEPEPNIVPYRCDADDDRTRWTPSIYMPRWASRVTLEITGVRIDRLQDISDEDALAEGVYPTSTGLYPGSPRAAYRGLWESINGLGSWDANPWVWVIEFKRILS